MRYIDHKYYNFETPAQWRWRDGVTHELAIDTAGLRVLPGFRLAPLERSSNTESHWAVAYDPCGQLYWVCERKGGVGRTLHLLRRLPDETREVGQLHWVQSRGRLNPIALAVGLNDLWLLADLHALEPQTRDIAGGLGEGIAEPGNGIPKLIRYHRESLRCRSVYEFDRNVLSMTSDNCDGVWVIFGKDDSNAALAHIDSSGQLERRVDLGKKIGEASVSLTNERDVIVMGKVEINPKEPRWTLWKLKDKDCKPSDGRALDLQFSNTDSWHMAVDCTNVVRILSCDAGQPSTLTSVSTSGDVVARQPIPGLPEWGEITSIAARADLTLAASEGIVTLTSTCAAAPALTDSLPAWTSPVLYSPEHIPGGWMRADIDAELSPGSVLEINSTSARNRELSVDAVRRTQLFRGSDWPPTRPLRLALHEIAGPYLTLQMKLHAEPGAAPPCIKAVRVFYPNKSYLSSLPAVYQKDDEGRRLMRSLLDAFESVFGDLDSKLDQIPRRINPETADVDWLPFLLQWLGLPSAAELTPGDRRRLLCSAPDLLRDMGTMKSLQSLLDIVVRGHYAITDSGAGPVPWTLPAHRRAGFGARLGRDSLVLMPKCVRARLGVDSTLPKWQLNHSFVDVSKLYARCAGRIEIRIAAAGERKTNLAAFLRRYLPYFIPAHCRYSVRFVTRDDLRAVRKLNSKDLLHDITETPLGVARAGSMKLKTDEGGTIATFGSESSFDSGQFLA